MIATYIIGSQHSACTGVSNYTREMHFVVSEALANDSTEQNNWKNVGDSLRSPILSYLILIASRINNKMQLTSY